MTNKSKSEEKQETDNGKEAPPIETMLPKDAEVEVIEIAKAPLEMRAMQYKARLGQLEAELRVQIRPFIKTYNDGRQVADIELVALE